MPSTLELTFWTPKNVDGKVKAATISANNNYNKKNIKHTRVDTQRKKEKKNIFALSHSIDIYTYQMYAQKIQQN